MVNDTCGHTAGDELLRQISQKLNDEVRKSDSLARLGGDEFGVLMEHCDLRHAERVATQMLESVRDFHFSWLDRSFRISASIGIVDVADAPDSFSELLKLADLACYAAKDQGRNQIQIYHPEDQNYVARQGEMHWITRINKALAENLFCLYLQPIASTRDRAHKHFEVLIRMKDDNGEVIAPGAFLPAAERYGLIGDIDRWVVKEALATISANPDIVGQVDFVAINLSGPSMANQAFKDYLLEKIAEPGVEASKLCFEVTESVAISNLTQAKQFMLDLKQHGCKFALDDFGSGLSSFGYLKSLPVDYLKIDGVFVKDMVNDPIDRAMVKSINEIGHVMGKKTIAEFVENQAIIDLLAEMGVDYCQGYGVSAPFPMTDLIVAGESEQPA